MSKKPSKEKKQTSPEEREQMKKDNFERVITPRVNKLLNDFRLVKQVIGGNNYSMSEEQVNKIYLTLEKELISINNIYIARNKSKEQREKFTL